MIELVKLEVQPDGKLKIVLTPEGRQRIMEEGLQQKPTDEALYDLLERPLCNGWSWIPPEAIGALTAAPILSDDATVDDDGDWQVGRVFWHGNYMVEDPIESLLTQGYVMFDSGS